MTGRRRRVGPGAPAEARDGTVAGVITIVQEDRFRLMDDAGRGYLFTPKKGTVRTEALECWRDGRRRVRVRYRGVPDLGASAIEVAEY